MATETDASPVKQELGGGLGKESSGESKGDGKIGRGNNDRNKGNRMNYNQSYDWSGECEGMTAILALPNEKFANKVAYSVFIDKLKNYVIGTFHEGKDMVPIIEDLKDPKSTVKANEPPALTESEEKSEVKKWMKQEEVKLYIKRLTLLETNQQRLYAIVWGQLTESLREVIKTETDFESNDSSFNCIWLLKQAKLSTSGVNSKVNKQCS